MWLPFSADLTYCEFWLWFRLKRVIYEGNVDDLANLNDRIAFQVKQINVELL